MTARQARALAGEQSHMDPAESDDAGPDLGHAERWAERVRATLSAEPRTAFELADKALSARPGDGELLLLAALAALVGAFPGRALVYLKRFQKRHGWDRAALLLTGIALAQQEKVAQASALLRKYGLARPWQAAGWFVGGADMDPWLRETLTRIERAHNRQLRAAAKPRPAAPRPPPSPTSPAPPAPALAEPALLPKLPRVEVSFDTQFEFTNPQALQIEGEASEPHWFRLRTELGQLGLLQGFDELLCLAGLAGVETHGYQVETLRKVLKQFRGRVLLADEVGLGKTIEAGMVLREYGLRGMAERVLILTPASLVGQWREELETKFGLSCATTHDPLLREDPSAFWRQKRIIASIAAARRLEHADCLRGESFDLVIVDEAHHLRDRSSQSWKLVDALNKRFLLLLSATPVQNDLVELYNLLTLLKSGIFKSQKEFRSAYMTPGHPRQP